MPGPGWDSTFRSCNSPGWPRQFRVAIRSAFRRNGFSATPRPPCATSWISRSRSRAGRQDRGAAPHHRRRRHRRRRGGWRGSATGAIAAPPPTYAKLTPWQKTLVARHPERPTEMTRLRPRAETEWTPLAATALRRRRRVVGGLGPLPRPRRRGARHREGHDTDSRCGTISAWRVPKATARRGASVELAGRVRHPFVLRGHRRRLPGIEAEARGQARPSPAPSKPASTRPSPSWRPSSAKAAPARHRARRRRPHPDAGALDLLGHQPRRLRLHLCATRRKRRAPPKR